MTELLPLALLDLNSLSAKKKKKKKKQTTKFTSVNFHKTLSPRYIILRIEDTRANSVDLNEVAHDEPPHQDLRFLQIQQFSSLVKK